ncbi:MAG: TadE/TadG family type IV pilus assembly protein, partial [Acidimicrobiales bacterium]
DRCRRDDGTALVEFALISVLLLTIVFAIINLGLVLSFKQDVTRAAAEGARAAAVALPSSVEGDLDPRRLAGEAAVQEAVDGFNQECGVDGMTCASQIHDCGYTVAPTDLDPTPDSNGYKNNTEPDCVTVKVRYDYENHPLLVPMPLISAFLPDEVNAASVVRLNE